MEKLLISSCLLGNNCRYDGKSNKLEKLNKLKQYYELVPVCPEVDGGLPTPRVPSEIKNNKVINKENEDNTSYFKKGAEIALSICKEQNITKALLKSKSPSCGSNKIYDGTFTNTIIDGDGVTAKLLKERDVKDLYNEAVSNKVNQELEAILKDILKEYHFEAWEGDLKEVFGNDILGATDFLNKIIYLAKSKDRKEITMPEEFAHAFIKLMGARYRKETYVTA